MKLAEMSQRKCQNLHFIKFIAAIAVMFFHAFSIATGDSSEECIVYITNGELNFGMLAVSIFFLVGGFFIAKSIQRLKTGKAYFKARMRKILPPLVFVNFLVMIMGAFFSKYTIKQYFGMVETWKYMLNSIFILVHNLPGVFVNNVYSQTVNGSLWTLPVEVFCYIACFIIYRLGFMSRKKFKITLPIVLVFFCGIYYMGNNIQIIRSLIRPCMLFYIGMFFWIYRDKILLEKKWAIISFVCLCISIYFRATNVGMILFFPYIVFVLCFEIKQVSELVGSLGNYSYGIYLWGFPVQQAITQKMGGAMNPYLNFILALPIVMILARITYLFTEKR